MHLMPIPTDARAELSHIRYGLKSDTEYADIIWTMREAENPVSAASIVVSSGGWPYLNAAARDAAEAKVKIENFPARLRVSK